MPSSRIDGDLIVTGNLQPVAFTAPPGSIVDASLNTSSKLAQDKYKPQYKKNLAQSYGVVAASERRVVHIAEFAGTLYRIRAGLVLPNAGAATVTIDLKKNGTSVLTAVITLTSAGVAYIPTDGTILTSSYALDEVFELVIVATAGGGTLGQGLFVDVLFRDNSNG